MKPTHRIRIAFGVFLLSLLLCTTVHGHEWMAPKEAADRVNPVSMGAGAIERGSTVYRENCAICHGERLEGLAPEITGLVQATPDLRKRARAHSDGDFFWKIQNGRGDMPSFKEDLSDEQVWDVIIFIKHRPE